jgi:hypothetical protein
MKTEHKMNERMFRRTMIKEKIPMRIEPMKILLQLLTHSAFDKRETRHSLKSTTKENRKVERERKRSGKQEQSNLHMNQATKDSDVCIDD